MLLAQDLYAPLATTRSKKLQKSSRGQRQRRPNRPFIFKGDRYHNCGREGLSSSNQNFRVFIVEKVSTSDPI